MTHHAGVIRVTLAERFWAKVDRRGPDDLLPGCQADNVRDMVARRRGLIGTLNGQSKLDEQAIRAIRADRAAGATNRALGDRYGVSPSYVTRIFRRTAWAHVA